MRLYLCKVEVVIPHDVGFANTPEVRVTTTTHLRMHLEEGELHWIGGSYWVGYQMINDSDVRLYCVWADGGDSSIVNSASVPKPGETKMELSIDIEEVGSPTWYTAGTQL